MCTYLARLEVSWLQAMNELTCQIKNEQKEMHDFILIVSYTKEEQRKISTHINTVKLQTRLYTRFNWFVHVRSFVRVQNREIEICESERDSKQIEFYLVHIANTMKNAIHYILRIEVLLCVFLIFISQNFYPKFFFSFICTKKYVFHDFVFYFLNCNVHIHSNQPYAHQMNRTERKISKFIHSKISLTNILPYVQVGFVYRTFLFSLSFSLRSYIYSSFKFLSTVVLKISIKKKIQISTI